MNVDEFGTVFIEDNSNINPTIGNNSSFVDSDGTTVVLSNRLILRLYTLLEHEVGTANLDFEEWCKVKFKDIKINSD